MTDLGRFDDDWLFEFRRKSKISDEAALKCLQRDLQEVGKHYRHIIETTPCDLKGSPFNKTLTQRGDWMQANVVGPARKLLAALGAEQAPWFSTWPYEHEFKEFPDRVQLSAKLQEVLEFSERLVATLRGEQQADAATNQELRFYIFKDAYAAVRKNLPDFTPKQSTYGELDDEKTKRFVDPFSEAMRHIYAEITGLDEQLVRLIRMVIQDPNWDL
jgi:hypothetical protein